MKDPDYIEFGLPDLGPIAAVMDRMSDTHAGWVNLEPAIEAEAAPDEPGFFGLFSGRGPSVPLATWTPASSPGRGRAEPAMVGLQHGAGSRAKALLAEMDNAVPDGWRVTQDHVRKGLVVAVPDTSSNIEILEWLLRAATAMSTVPLTGRWRAVIYET